MAVGRPFNKGEGGRPKGVQNKATKAVKEVVLSVFTELQTDTKANLKTWAKNNLTEFYKISSKLIPTDMKAEVKHTGKVILNINRGNKGSND